MLGEPGAVRVGEGRRELGGEGGLEWIQLATLDFIHLPSSLGEGEVALWFPAGEDLLAL